MAPKRPYDDLETDYLEEENESGFLSLVSVVIAFIAVAVFIALAWYAYQSNTDSGAKKEIEVVYPEDGPVREAPEETGGWQFPHQDKSVYNIVSNGEEEQEAKVEQILPAPEQPVKRPDAETKTWMNDRLKDDTIAPTDAERQKEAKKRAVEEQQKAEEEAQEEFATQETESIPVDEEAAATAENAEPTPPAMNAESEKPAIKNATEIQKSSATNSEKKAAASVPPAKQEVTKPAPTKPSIASTSSSAGAIKIQLGAVRSEADARSQWQKISSKFDVLNGKSLQVQSVNIPGKGMFYRIQAAGFLDRNKAQAACAKLTAAGQACFVVGK